MSETLAAVRSLVASGEVRISEHGYDELAEDGIPVKDIINSVSEAAVVEDYTTFPKGPAVLVLQFDANRQPVHIVWGIPQGHSSPAVLATAYRPDPQRWSDDLRERLK